MCNRYRPSRADKLVGLGYEPQFVGETPGLNFDRDIGPYGTGVFIRVREDRVEEVAGQWGLIGWFAKSPQPERVKGRPKILTNNARFETIHKLATFKDPWARGQRCIIPAWCHFEPNWETGKNVWWRLRLAGPGAYGLAGIWNTWTDKETGEVHESYSMVTVNCDSHPLLSRMHRPDPERPATMQDKRAVVPLAPENYQAWLSGTIEQATQALTLPPEEAFEAGPEVRTHPNPTPNLL